MDLRPKLIITATGIVALLILLSLAQEMHRRWEVQREVRELEGEAAKLEQNIVELEHLNQYFRTDAYQERLAREKLNYKAPGEKVVLIPEQAREQAEQQAANEEPSKADLSVFMRWWELFFVEQPS